MNRNMAVAIATLFGVAFAASSYLIAANELVVASDATDTELERLRNRVDALESRLVALEKSHEHEPLVTGIIPFGDVVTNLQSDRYQRYIQIKLVVVTAESQDPAVRARLAQKKAELKSWLLSYLSGQSPESMSGTKNFERTRADVLAEFDRHLSAPGTKGHVKDVLFTEYVIQ